jgi:DNA-binding response OmpR family regulator
MNEHKMPVVVIADNEQDISQFVRVTFRLAGFEAHTANSVDECIRRINEEVGVDKVDIVCMDGKLAADRAAMLIVKIKRVSNGRIKVFVIAERYLDETKTRVLDYGADEFVFKPISLTSIVEKVNTLLVESVATTTTGSYH